MKSTPQESIRVAIELDRGSESISGSIQIEDGPSEHFCGWIELAVFLEEARSPSSGVASTLSPMEERVVVRASRGLTNPQIAEELVLSPRTVQGHLYRAFKKLGVSSRTQLVSAWFRQTQLTGVGRASASHSTEVEPIGSGELRLRRRTTRYAPERNMHEKDQETKPRTP